MRRWVIVVVVGVLGPILLSVGVASSGPGSKTQAEAEHASPPSVPQLECDPGDPETSTVSTYALGSSGRGTPRDELQDYLLANALSNVSPEDFAVREGSDQHSVLVLDDGTPSTVAVALLEDDGSGGWRVTKFNACYEFERRVASGESPE
jgi:hypothetical protein